MYLSTISRPDLAFAIGRLASGFKQPTVEMWERMKRVLKYLNATKGTDLKYRRNTKTLQLDLRWFRVLRRSGAPPKHYRLHSMFSWSAHRVEKSPARHRCRFAKCHRIYRDIRCCNGYFGYTEPTSRNRYGRQNTHYIWRQWRCPKTSNWRHGKEKGKAYRNEIPRHTRHLQRRQGKYKTITWKESTSRPAHERKPINQDPSSPLEWSRVSKSSMEMLNSRGWCCETRTRLTWHITDS